MPARAPRREDADASVTSRSLNSSNARGRVSTTQQHHILPLSAEAITQICSAKHITTLQEAVLGLLKNSLDAGANKIDVSVNWFRGACIVEDNGTGIPLAEFTENGGLARMHCTSKQAPVGSTSTYSKSTYGSSGTHLAHLAATSLLRIASKHAGSEFAASLAIHHGKVIMRLLPDRVPSISDSVSQGTRVSIDDLFGTMPVRVKQRMSAASKDDRTWQELKREVVALLLAWPNPCSIRIRDVAVDDRVLNIAGQNSTTSTILTKKALNQLAGASAKHDLLDALPVIFQAGLAPSRTKSRWIPLSASTSSISLQGLVCADPAPTKTCQFLALGIHPYHSAVSHCNLHDIVNKLFAQSTFGITADEDDEPKGSEGHVDYDTTNNNLQAKSITKPRFRRGVDRYPMYAMRLDSKEHPSDLLQSFEQINDATLEAIVGVLDAAVTAWLERTHFISQKRVKQHHNAKQHLFGSTSRLFNPSNSETKSVEGPKSFSRLRTSNANTVTPPAIYFNEKQLGSRSDLQDSSHQSAGDCESNACDIDLDVRGQPDTSVDRLNTSLQSLHHDQDNMVSLNNDYGSIDEEDLLAVIQASETPVLLGTGLHNEEITDWRDPITTRQFQVNARTGIVLHRAQFERQQEVQSTNIPDGTEDTPIDSGLTSASEPFRLASRNRLVAKEPNFAPGSLQSQLPAFIRNWKNPIFPNQNEEPIPITSRQGTSVSVLNELNHHGFSGTRGNIFDQNDTGILANSQLSRCTLAQAIVVGQVDAKFILCILPEVEPRQNTERSSCKTKELLVLIDQHAASERVILENLLDGLYTHSRVSGTSSCDTNHSVIRSIDLVGNTTHAKCLLFEIPHQEADMFRLWSNHFALLGVIYIVVPVHTEAATAGENRKPSGQHDFLKVTHLPVVVAERCASFPTLCIDMLRTELWELANGTKRQLTCLPPAPLERREAAVPYWVSLMPLLPKKLVSMLHSRACRSGIMFNDPLDLEECDDLVVRKLSRCVFPFICAHGRVAMVPLGYVGEGTEHESLLRPSEVEKPVLRGHSAQGDLPNEYHLETFCRTDKIVDWMTQKNAKISTTR